MTLINVNVTKEYKRIKEIPEEERSQVDKDTLRLYEIAERRQESFNDLALKIGTHVLNNQGNIHVKNITGFKELYDSLDKLLDDKELFIVDNNFTKDRNSGAVKVEGDNYNNTTHDNQTVTDDNYHPFG